MMKDEFEIRIPSVFIPYQSGEWLLEAMNHTLPWNPVRITMDLHGECKSMMNCRQLRGAYHEFLTNSETFPSLSNFEVG